MLGGGKRLFSSFSGAGGRVPVKLASSEAFGTGVLHVTYQPATT